MFTKYLGKQNTLETLIIDWQGFQNWLQKEVTMSEEDRWRKNRMTKARGTFTDFEAIIVLTSLFIITCLPTRLISSLMNNYMLKDY